MIDLEKKKFTCHKKMVNAYILINNLYIMTIYTYFKIVYPIQD